MHAARLATSPRLQRTLRTLADARGRWLSTRTILRRAQICAVNSCIAELRQNGARIDCVQRVCRDGRRRWHYRLIAAPEGFDG